MKLSNNFNLIEFTKSSTAIRRGISNTPSDLIIDNIKALVVNVLQPIRSHYNKTMVINSGYRSTELNNFVGGSKSSQHCSGQAADIEVFGIANLDLAIFIRDHLEFDQLILECYKAHDPSSGWVHVSWVKNRKQTLTWDGKSYQSGF
jgi:hypothetical protein